MLSALRVKRPEGVLVGCEREMLTRLRFAVGILAKDQEVAVGADQNLAVVLEVASDLRRARNPHDVLCRAFDLHNTALR